ncbi:helix-turn-helix domain-containing protein [Comamonas guangdongensis]|uniref:Helix-turn-helix domain-containing protein n=1 Tax=Comamonas guangdongensis TaxID=510515 RepID=A0ABV3ZXE1_9BURK
MKAKLHKIEDLCNLGFIPKPAVALESLPRPVKESLEILGHHLRLSRKRRGESLRAWALRMDTSVPTLSAIEKGDPRVSMGVYATALWLVGRDKALRDLASPENDARALVQEVSAIPHDNERTMTRADKREVALFAFLAKQAKAPDEEQLLSQDFDEATRENLGFLVLLLAITVERYASLEAITKLNCVATQLLGPRLNNED